MSNHETRRNRRARTLTSIPVRDNRVFEILVSSDGYGIGRGTFYYRRNSTAGYRYTGPAPIGSVHGHFTPRNAGGAR